MESFFLGSFLSHVVTLIEIREKKYNNPSSPQQSLLAKMTSLPSDSPSLSPSKGALASAACVNQSSLLCDQSKNESDNESGNEMDLAFGAAIKRMNTKFLKMITKSTKECPYVDLSQIMHEYNMFETRFQDDDKTLLTDDFVFSVPELPGEIDGAVVEEVDRIVKPVFGGIESSAYNNQGEEAAIESNAAFGKKSSDDIDGLSSSPKFNVGKGKGSEKLLKSNELEGGSISKKETSSAPSKAEKRHRCNTDEKKVDDVTAGVKKLTA